MTEGSRHSERGWNVGWYFAAGTLVWLVLAVLLTSDSESGLDIYIHDTYFVVGHFDFLWLASILNVAFAVIYLAFPALRRDSLSRLLGQVHFWATTAGFATLAWIVYGIARHYMNLNTHYTHFLVEAIGIVFFAQIPFVLLFFQRSRSRREAGSV